MVGIPFEWLKIWKIEILGKLFKFQSSNHSTFTLIDDDADGKQQQQPQQRELRRLKVWETYKSPPKACTGSRGTCHSLVESESGLEQSGIGKQSIGAKFGKFKDKNIISTTFFNYILNKFCTSSLAFYIKIYEDLFFFAIYPLLASDRTRSPLDCHRISIGNRSNVSAWKFTENNIWKSNARTHSHKPRSPVGGLWQRLLHAAIRTRTESTRSLEHLVCMQHRPPLAGRRRKVSSSSDDAQDVNKCSGSKAR